ncbi:sacsin N-terminal ATP-binding-like domain-containing protein [Pedobacter alluvionis]|uniref:ATP-binding protein n=1 Tax=Pedobacter alluvionis TaxID=475253 RepID=A0A497XY55_9SPHI|nr:sensor histidine kinase [Pedobacter alluvionis]RLJ73667.1 hypothetical protein BCL90_3829 [Pedobacter alluvionis]TFB32709.1 ATP-binding protein [Pedobacter alluvionis]
MSEINETAIVADSLESTKERVMSANNANEIYEHIKQLGNEPKHRHRWIWELMQNAQDVAIGGKVAVEIAFDGREVTFTHDGHSFTEEDITHLIYHGSSKPGMAGKTGKFGTGFMTTHLLSRQVRVKGCLTNGRFFDFVLNREATDGADMLTVLDASWKDFKSSLTDTGIPGLTSYSYLELSPTDILATVDPVMASLENLVPPVMAFSGIISKVSVNNKGIVKTFVVADSPREDEVAIAFSPGDNQSVFLISDIPGHRAKIAVPMDSSGRIRPIAAGMARLFITFPLVGTDQAFPLPFLIHSQDFEPNKEREKIWLQTGTAQVAVNKAILEAAWAAYGEMCVRICADTHYADIHLLADTGGLPLTEWMDRDWYRQQLNLVFEKLDGLDLVTNNSDGTKIPLSGAIIPYGDEQTSEALWTAWNHLAPAQVPQKEMVGYWKQVIDDRLGFSNQAKHPAAFELSDLCSRIDGVEDNKLDALVLTGIEALDFLIQVVALIEQSQKQVLWSEYAVLADQNRVLRKFGALRAEEKGDDSISEALKDIAEGLQFDIRKELIHPSITIASADHQLQPYKKSTLVNALLEKVKGAKLESCSDAFQQNSRLLLEWLLTNDRADSIPGFPVLLKSGEWEKISIGSDALLSPQGIWPEPFQRFAELFPDDFVLDSSYGFIFSQPELVTKAKGWLLKEPLYYSQETIRPDNIRHLVNRREDRDKLATAKGEEWKMSGTVQVSQLAYFSRPQDKSIIDRARGSLKRTRMLLEFITEVLLSVDSKGQMRTEIQVRSDDQEISVGIVPSLWMRDIKVREWVKSKVSVNSADRPSVESFLPYFDNKEENAVLYQSLQRQEVARWLHFLDIGVGDLLRNIRSGDNEEEKMDWDQSYVSILMNNRLTPASVTAMLGDHEFIELYEIKKRNDKLREENKKIGTLVEEAFRQAFEQLPGYSIKPEPIGSDFIVESDYDHYLLLERPDKRAFTVEIKSSRSSDVKMSKKQGETARITKENYILCVVPLDGSQVDAAYVMRSARFVTDIACLLESRVIKVQELDRMKDEAADTLHAGQIWTAIEGMEVRYCISQGIWSLDRENVTDFKGFVSGSIVDTQ